MKPTTDRGRGKRRAPTATGEVNLAEQRAEAAEHRSSFCEYLRASRAQSELSLEDIARETKIPRRSLERLETGRFEELPADVFVRGFLRSYARCVGIDGDDAIARYARCGLTPAPVASDQARALLRASAVAETMTPPPPSSEFKSAAKSVEKVEAERRDAFELAADGEGEVVYASEVEADAQVEADAEVEVEAKPETETEAKTETEIEAKIEAKTETEADAEVQVAEAKKPPRKESKKARKRRRRRERKARQRAKARAVVEASAEEPAAVTETEAEPADNTEVVEAEAAVAEAAGAQDDAVEAEAAHDEPIAADAAADEPKVEAEAGDEVPPALDDWYDSVTVTPPEPIAIPRRAQAPSLVIDDDDPEAAEVEREAMEKLARADDTKRSFIPPALLDPDDGSRRGALTLAVIILVIVATLTMSYLLRRPSSSGGGVTYIDHVEQPTPAFDDSTQLS